MKTKTYIRIGISNDMKGQAADVNFNRMISSNGFTKLRNDIDWNVID